MESRARVLVLETENVALTANPPTVLEMEQSVLRSARTVSQVSFSSQLSVRNEVYILIFTSSSSRSFQTHRAHRFLVSYRLALQIVVPIGISGPTSTPSLE